MTSAFDGDYSALDWDHGLGGMHALAWDGASLVGHASVVARRLLHGGRSLRCGYVEGVAVGADHRRRGCGSALMAAMELFVRGGYDLGALTATASGARLYVGHGWQPWRGTTCVLTPDGVRRTPEEDDAVHVLSGAVPLDLTGELTCDWRDGDVW